MRLVRVMKRLDYKGSFRMVELRLGNADESDAEGRERMSRNPVFGYYQGPDSEEAVYFSVEDGMAGRFLTLQRLKSGKGYFEVNEIYVTHF